MAGPSSSSSSCIFPLFFFELWNGETGKYKCEETWMAHKGYEEAAADVMEQTLLFSEPLPAIYNPCWIYFTVRLKIRRHLSRYFPMPGGRLRRGDLAIDQ